MNKRGFSLIELMGIIILLSIISVLVIPSIDRAMRDFKTKSYNNQLQTIRLAANDWSTDNLGKYSMDDGQMVTIVLGQLKSGGYLQDEIINTKTNEPFPDDMQINIVRVEDTLKYYVLDTTGSATGNYEGAPNIALNGDYIQRVSIDSVYTELGAYATSYTGAAISGITTVIKNSSDQVVSSINTSTEGEYKVFYSVTNNGLTRTIYRSVIVYSYEEFTLSLNGASTINHPIGTAYVDAGAIAYDPIDGSITGSINVQNGVDQNKVGLYYVNYSITNSSGKTITKKRKVIVSDTIPPVVTLVGSPTMYMFPGIFNNPGATVTDNIDTGLTISVGGNLAAGSVGTYTVTYTATDNSGNSTTVSRSVTVFNPTVTYSANGNPVAAQTGSTSVTVNNTYSVLDTGSLEYQWTNNTTQPTEATFTTSFINGNTITSPTSLNGTYYLWILVKDLMGNPYITRTNGFVLSNSIAVDYLIVGGGGAGGGSMQFSTVSGGGGGGGVIAGNMSLTSGSYPITIGAGGTTGGGYVYNDWTNYGNIPPQTAGQNGGNSTAFGFTALGGGGGARATTGANQPARTGGSGGGGASINSMSGAAGTAGQGYAGGAGINNRGGGGGGAGGAGGIGGTNGGTGGAGYLWLNGVYYAGGGGGGYWSTTQDGNNRFGTATAGGGKGGQAYFNSTTHEWYVPGAHYAAPGTPNTGGGGGGAPGFHEGQNGGSGVVIVRYLGTAVATGGTITSSGGYTYHTFTSNGTLTVN